MTSLVVLPSKKKVDIKTISVDFEQELLPGDSIATVDVLVQVFEGIDNNPSAILFGATDFSGTIVTQDVHEGIVGVVYSLLFTVNTVNGFTALITARLAITPDSLPAEGSKAPYFLSSKLYPMFNVESLNMGAIPMSGFLRIGVLDYSLNERLDMGAIPTGGALRLPLIDYMYFESLDMGAIPTGGLLRETLRTTTETEKLDMFAVPTSGLLRDALITTTNTEELDMFAVPTGGSLYVP